MKRTRWTWINESAANRFLVSEHPITITPEALDFLEEAVNEAICCGEMGVLRRVEIRPKEMVLTRRIGAGGDKP